MGAASIATGAREPGAATPIPSDLGEIKFTATGKLSSQFALVHLFAEKGFKGYALVDSAGRIAWHYRTRDYPFGAARRKNGNFVFMDKGYGLVEVDRAGTIVHELKQRDAEHEMHHGIVVTPRDTVLYLAFDTEPVDGKPLKGEAIWEWTPGTGEDVKRWRSWDHLSPALDRSKRTAGEWLHANSLACRAARQHPRQLSLPGSGDLDRARLEDDPVAARRRARHHRGAGGSANVRATHRSRDRTESDVDVRQPHGSAAAILARGRVRDRPAFAQGSGAASGGRAKQVWQWKAPNNNYASAVSSARRLSNGNTLIAFGMEKGRNGSSGPTEAYEVTPAGQIAWHLVVEGVMTMFRVEPVNSFDP